MNGKKPSMQDMINTGMSRAIAQQVVTIRAVIKLLVDKRIITEKQISQQIDEIAVKYRESIEREIEEIEKQTPVQGVPLKPEDIDSLMNNNWQ